MSSQAPCRVPLRLALAHSALVAAACGGPMLSTAVETPPSAAPVSDWPMYGHDASRTSFNAAETRLSFGSVARLAPAWQVDIGTNGVPGFSAPSIANGRVYVGSSVGEGDDFLAFDAASGQLLWGANLNSTESLVCDPDENVGIGSTPVVSGSVVVVGGGDAAYYGLNADTGAVLWRHPLGVGPGGFAWESPLVANDRAFLGIASQCDMPAVRGELRAVDLQTGVVQARQFFASEGGVGGGIWNSPALTPDSRTVVVATGEDDGDQGPLEQALVTLDSGTLQILGADKEGAPQQDLDFASTPVVFHDKQNRTLAAASHKDGNIYAYALDALASGPIWTRSFGTIVGLAPAYDPTAGDGGTLFVGGVDGVVFDGSNAQLHALDPATGLDRWPPASVGFMLGNVAIANGLIFVNTGAGGVRILDERNGQLLRVLVPASPGNTFTGVAVAGGTVYWLSGSRLNAWRAP